VKDERLKGNRLTIYQAYPEGSYGTLKKIECIWPIARIHVGEPENQIPAVSKPLFLIQSRFVLVSWNNLAPEY